MKLRHISRAAVVALLAAGVVAPTSAFAATANTQTSITVSITTPDGVAANVELTGPTHRVIAKQAHGSDRTATVVVPAGTYTVSPDTAMFHDQVYTGQATPESVVVADGDTASVSVTYTGEPTAASNLHLTALTGTSASLAWDAPGNGPFSLRRTEGKKPAASRTDGVAVAMQGTSATDGGLTAGTTYSYALFAKVRGTWVGPLSLTVGTTPPAGTNTVTYVTAPGTMLATADEIASEQTTGSAVIVSFQPGVALPLDGDAVVLPPSVALPGGYLGAVSDVATDGQSVTLQGTGLSAAFTYYSLHVAEFSTGPVHLTPSGASAAAPQAHKLAPAHAAAEPHKAAPSSTSVQPHPVPAPPTASADAAAHPNAASPNAESENCLGGLANVSVEFDPDLELNGSFDVSISHGWFGIPDGASMNGSLGVTLSGPMNVETEAEISCGIHFPNIMETVAVDPVPISFLLAPKAEFTFGGGISLENIGVTASSGVNFSGSLGISGASFSSSPYLQASVLPPTITANGQVGAVVGGQVVFGPGAGSSGAGVIAGISGELDLLHATFGPVFSQEDGRFNHCLTANASLDADLGLTAKAWIADWSASASYDLWKGSWPYGSWYAPDGCENEPAPDPNPTPTPTPTQPGDSVLGPGVTKVSDSTEGAPDQVGYVGGLVPGHNTWLLSTGNVADAVGSPDTFASTDMGMPGDADLTALSGNPTYDAAAYQVTLVPSGSTLHVKYVFASEEYPEFVGSQYNDVMEILVDGVNCALVPDTSTPVAINTVNDHTNAQYYVDNSTGAAGYDTVYDGLTVPLTCSVPVTPGQPVTVKIAVADASDHIYDSGVALLDDGIWSD